MSLAFDNAAFWAIAAVMTAVALAFVLPAFFCARRETPSPARRARLVAETYRSNLSELDREHDAGRLTHGEYAQAREEIERALLGELADAAPLAAPARSAPALRRAVFTLVVVALPALAFALYAFFGEPGALERAPDGELAASGSASGAPISRDDLVRHLAHKARDGRAWVLLARIDFAADRFSEAAESYGKALAASPRIAADAGIWCEYADALGMAQGGVLAGVPREHVMRALALDPAHPKALEMAGSAAFEQSEFVSAARYWRSLLAQFPERSVEHRELSAAIASADALASAAPGGGDRAR